MKTTIPHSQTTPTNDLLNLPDIDGVFNEVKGQSAPEPSQTTLKAAPTDIRQTNGSWQLFQQYAQQYGYRVKKYDRKNYEIDNEGGGFAEALQYQQHVRYRHHQRCPPCLHRHQQRLPQRVFA